MKDENWMKRENYRRQRNVNYSVDKLTLTKEYVPW